MKIALLSGINVIHTTRWANALSEKGHEVHLITQHRGGDALSGRVRVRFLPFQGNKGYYLNVPFLRNYLKAIKPDLLHAHYASGYGTLGRLSGFHPYMLSVWGSDVYDFPYRSFFAMRLVRKNLKAADIVASTSHAMAEQTRKICDDLPEIPVTPFGIDTGLFKPDEKQKQSQKITVGTVKTLAFKYGIDILIKGFAKAREAMMATEPGTGSELRLLIVGGGKDREKLEQLAGTLGISGVTEFTGAVPHGKVPGFLNRLDIYVATSRIESFGVAILEASSCELPVIVSDAGGLPEVVENGVTGLVVPKENGSALAEAIEKLAIDKALREEMGRSGRKRVMDLYSWDKSVSLMEEIYSAFGKSPAFRI